MAGEEMMRNGNDQTVMAVIQFLIIHVEESASEKLADISDRFLMGRGMFVGSVAFHATHRRTNQHLK